MKRAKNIREIAAAAGVSVATVSRTLKGGEAAEKVSTRLRERVLEVCEANRYHPNQHTVRMISGRANAVAFLAPPELLYPHSEPQTIDLNLTSALGAATEVLAASGLYLTLAPVNQRFLDDQEYLRLWRGKLVDGLLIWGWIDGQNYLPELQAEGVPITMIQCADPSLPFDQVVADDRRGMRLIVEHLLELGHRKIGYIPPLTSATAGRERDTGFRTALADAGVTPTAIASVGGFSMEAGEVGAAELLDRAPEITAIVAANDQSACGVLRTCAQRGIRVPDDLSVTGADGLQLLMPQALTTFVTPSTEIGRVGADLLLQRIAAPDSEPQRLVRDVALRIGETTAAPRA